MLPQCVCAVSTEAPERHERTCENKKEKKRKEEKNIIFFVKHCVEVSVSTTGASGSLLYR